MDSFSFKGNFVEHNSTKRTENKDNFAIVVFRDNKLLAAKLLYN